MEIAGLEEEMMQSHSHSRSTMSLKLIPSSVRLQSPSVFNTLHLRNPGFFSKLSICVISVIDYKGRCCFPDQGSEDLAFNALKCKFWKVCKLSTSFKWRQWSPNTLHVGHLGSSVRTESPSVLWGGRGWLQMGGPRGPLDGEFVTEWDYICRVQEN